MKNSLGIPNYFAHSQTSSPTVQALQKLLEEIGAEQTLIAKFNTACEICEFQLGDEITQYQTADNTNNLLKQKENDSNFYLVCEGRVRLLALEASQQQEISAVVLEVGAIFGTEKLFIETGLPYRAIAAGTCQIARIAASKLQLILEEFPQLQQHLQQEFQHIQRLIFFKTQTDLRSLAPHKQQLLWPHLLPYIEESRILAGVSLADHCQKSTNHFWLRSGQIQGEAPPIIGSSWGHSELRSDWKAATNLLIYQLSAEQWEIAKATVSSESNSRPKIIRKPPILSLVTLPKDASSTSKTEQSKLTDVEQQKAVGGIIRFPKPKQRRWLSSGHPFIQQQSAADCGATCLAMISEYWGKKFSLNYLRELAEIGRSGASLKSLAKAAERMGFQTRPVRASLTPLRNQNPWIAHWQGNHYVAVYRFKNQQVLVADPAAGKRWMSIKAFSENWTGYALLLDQTAELYRNHSDEHKGIKIKNFVGIVWPYRAAIAQILILSLLIQIFGLVTPLFTQVILDQVVVSKSVVTLHVFAIGLLLFSVWRSLLGATRQYLLDYLSNRIDLTLISGFISHTLSLPIKFFESRQVGDILTRVQENQKIQAFLTRQAITAWLDALMAVVYIGLMVYYNWRLALLVLALIPPIVILTLVATPFLRKVSREVFTESAKQNSSLVEMITGVATVKATAAEREMRWRWEDQLTCMINAKFRGQKLANSLQVIGGGINTLGSTALLWYGAMLVIQDDLTIGQFVAFNMMIGSVISPVLSVVGLWDEFQEVLVSIERLDDVFSAQPEESPYKPMLVLPRIQGNVKFDNVSFRYSQDEERNTLQNLSFEVQAGETVAIVGRSGSGKSTLVKLLQGFYYPEKGRLTIDGHDIRHISLQSLRVQLGVVPQDCFLFSGTILENITLYKNGNDAASASLEEAIEVAKLAEAHPFIQDMPLGYQTPVGERGTSLSGGQRQRIAIARALLGDPRILVLDEATSSLDTESERRFQQNLARISRDRTAFIIAHRLSTVRNADRILVLDKGILAEQGNHDELMAERGLYYHLAQQQLDI
ncbi:peptidase domain-containing ABC transporter [Microcoleus asticus]|uniref:Leukotoxin export ATP-binding protein LtxB n=1 Tax=Microcoleus asticus IPMA8 TaxID=2563858 RepID=A0ABX2CSI1_9CYAN|nr:ABC transporter transmembrane domain-containing protein [Microcoleus asticus]NQE33371.1 Leukotoxin export ATP-binding protein LtxB [Microcoleus asticus IPMA8]